ncbi:hypothetical protein BJ742DRAFT_782005 [Cladochytrium replicatum]|nr:hypothetical protein BJ742DRAFT_782005 [Cladochytrium replicatum]
MRSAAVAPSTLLLLLFPLVHSLSPKPSPPVHPTAAFSLNATISISNHPTPNTLPIPSQSSLLRAFIVAHTRPTLHIPSESESLCNLALPQIQTQCDANEHLSGLIVRGAEWWGTLDGLGRFTGLENLVVDDAKWVNGLGDDLGNLGNLRVLEVKGTGIREIPATARKLVNLETLVLSECPYVPWIEHTTLAGLVNLRWLELRWMMLNWLPESIGELRKLQHLGLHDMEAFGYLPGSFYDLPALKSLTLENTGFREIPEQITYLGQTLEVLIVSGNKNLWRVPGHVGWLVMVTHMSITGSPKLRELPIEITLMKSLRYLDIGGNGLEDVPDVEAPSKLERCVGFGNEFSCDEEHDDGEWWRVSRVGHVGVREACGVTSKCQVQR